jgi:hypothetical protein
MNSNKNILQTAVSVSHNQVTLRELAAREYIDRIKKLSDDLLTDDERNLLKFAKSYRSNIPMINLTDAIINGGLDEKGYPHLAVASYQDSIDRNEIQVKVFDDGEIRYYNKVGWHTIFSTGEDAFPRHNRGFFGNGYPLLADTIVPLVPPELRQKNPEDVLILFEVAKWNVAPRPADPYLLKHVAGNIYAILGSWDITQKELDTYRAIHI